jgi:hypothetical protein
MKTIKPQQFLVFTIVAGASFLLGACGPSATAAAVRTTIPATTTPVPVPVAAQTGASGGLTEQALKNAEYRLPDIGTFRLRDGQFEYSYGSSTTQVNKAGFLQAANGDLNGDGQADAAVVLWVTTGGSGTYIYLVAMLDQAGQPRQGGADPVGDRVQIQQLSVQTGKIIVIAKAFAKGDPMCCPSLQVTRTYRLDGSTLKVESETK